ncbi:glycosyltransferase family 4 protein [Streptomyces lavendulae]|uniref:glycosyltransferase family 4 protein n=1 Tax=Streptomyces lavendulae TaxID=1914 RepID=UPI0036AFC42C
MHQDASNQPSHEVPPSGTPRRRILLVSDVSGLGLGGVPVFNMELARGLAVRHDVTVLTVDPDPSYSQERTEEQHGQAFVINVPPSRADVEPREALEELVRRAPESYGLPSPLNDPFDLVIGHSRFSGPAAAALRERWYPRARLVHFLHTSPVRLDWIKGRWEKGARNAVIERNAMRRADVITGVGELLTVEARRLSEQVVRVPALHEFVPGTEIGERVRGPHGGDTLKLLLPGRATDEIKGVEGAIEAIGLLRNPGEQARYGMRRDVHLTVRGGPHPVREPEQYARWQQTVARYGASGAVTLLPFSTDPAELRADREGVDAIVMPSLHEGFGLVATEGAGRGVPVLVNEESGAAGFLSKAPDGVGEPCVVRQRGSGRAEAWARAIADLDRDLPGRWENAGLLYDFLKQYTWEHGGQALVDAAMRTTPATLLPDGKPYYGDVTSQAPGGMLAGTGGQRRPWAVSTRYDGSTGWTPGARETRAPWHRDRRLARSQSVE